jgi:hypothetical protein
MLRVRELASGFIGDPGLKRDDLKGAGFKANYYEVGTGDE